MLNYSLLFLFLSFYGITTNAKYDKLKLSIKHFKSDPEFKSVKNQVESVSTDSIEQKLAVNDTSRNPAVVHYRHLRDSIFGKHPRAKMEVGFVIFNTGKDSCIVGVIIDYYDTKRMYVELVPAIKQSGLWAYDFENMVNGYRSDERFGGFEYKESERDKMRNKLIDKSLYDLVNVPSYDKIEEIFHNLLVKRIVEAQ